MTVFKIFAGIVDKSNYNGKDYLIKVINEKPHSKYDVEYITIPLEEISYLDNEVCEK